MSMKLVALSSLLILVRAQMVGPNPATNVLSGAALTVVRTPINQIVSNLTEILQIIEKIFANPAAVPANVSNNLQYMYQTVYEILLEMTIVQREIGAATGVNPGLGK